MGFTLFASGLRGDDDSREPSSGLALAHFPEALVLRLR
jgi:hypothetical protein